MQRKPDSLLVRKLASADELSRGPGVNHHAAPAASLPMHPLPIPALGVSFAGIPINSRRLQCKLAVNDPGDEHEREADAVAERVMRMALPPQSGAEIVHSGARQLQRMCAHCEEEQEHRLQRKQTGASAAAAPPIVHQVLKSPGQPLDAATRAFMEPRFGRDFSNVRVHTDAHTRESARSVNALAYTVGHNVVFDTQKYTPGTDSGRRLLAHELTHVVQQSARPGTFTHSLGITGVSPAPRVARQTRRSRPATAPCNFNCTDAAFLALSAPDREAEFLRACPHGYPRSTNFFGQRIPGRSSKALRDKLLDAEVRARRAMCLNGRDPAAFTLDRRISTYATHSPAEDRAVDIDYEGQPYIMHRRGGAAVDAEVGPVYNRIVFWARYQKSIIPRGITSVQRGVGGGTARTWVDPETHTRQAITTGELYDRLRSESDAMQEYFALLSRSNAELQHALEAFLMFNNAPMNDLARLGLPIDHTTAAAQAFRATIANDYRILGGSRTQLESFAGSAIASASRAPRSSVGRPFSGGAAASVTPPGRVPDPSANRRPELGFVTLPREVVVALTEVGLAWGAIDFGPESGDVMHFDCRNTRC